MDKDKLKKSFKSEVEQPLLNSVRRYINEIPVLAIEEVEIFKNDSAMYDETLAHRIGLVPLKNQKVASGKEIELKLAVKKEGNVYSEELKGADVVYAKIPLTILNKGQEIELLAKAKQGKGTEHSKYSPGILNYREIFNIKVDKEVNKEKIVNVCPKRVFSIEGDKLKIKEEKCDMCEACKDILEDREKIQIIPSKEIFVEIESFGQIGVKDLIPLAIKELKKDLDEISKKV